MPRAIDKAINHTEFNEFVYNVMSSVRPEIRSKLPAKYLKVYKSIGSLRTFAHHIALDKQVEVLTELGIDMWIVFAPNPNVAALCILPQEVKDDDPSARLKLINTMTKEKVFVLGSREVVTRLNVTSQNAHTRAYAISSSAVSLSDMMAKIRSEMSYRTKATKANEAELWLTKVCLAVLNSETFMESISNADKLEMRVLNALTIHQNNAVDMDKLLGYLGMQRGSIMKCITGLLAKGYIFADDKKKSQKHYMITTEGLKKNFEFTNYVKRVSLPEDL